MELMGTDKPDIPEGLSEATRVGIGIVVGLTIAFTIAIVFLCLVRASLLLSIFSKDYSILSSPALKELAQCQYFELCKITFKFKET